MAKAADQVNAYIDTISSCKNNIQALASTLRPLCTEI
jgi:hypothetical protein